MPREIKNIGASVRARLLNIARARNQPFELLLTRYVLERLLYRLSKSDYRDRFILKGAMLMAVWFPDPHRPTRDLDLLGFGDPDPEAMIGMFREVCEIPSEDGVEFDKASLRVDPIREQFEYAGQRLRMTAMVAGARINVVVDVAFGDAIEPGTEEIELPVLLAFPAPCLRAYPKETVISEKLHAMVLLGLSNSRLKDYYDVWMLNRAFEIDDQRLARAIAATFQRRGTAFPNGIPAALSDEFSNDARTQQQWDALAGETGVDPGSLEQVVIELRAFLMPRIEDASSLAEKAEPNASGL